MSNLSKLLFAGTPPPAVPPAPALSTDLDSTNDYLSRASDFTGNTNSKTFTISGWFYYAGGNNFMIGLGDGTTNKFLVSINGDDLSLSCRNSVNTIILSAAANDVAPRLGFNSFAISLDLANASNREIVVNDTVATVNWNTYTNDFIDFTANSPHIGALTAGTIPWDGRLADIFLDYTYRDLSIEANRRLFTTIDPNLGLVSVGGDALATLNPIFTAFTDPDDQALNQGTGGAWTVNGIMARSNRGVNQFNAVASEIDGSNFLTYSDSAANGTLFYTRKLNGINEHVYQTGSVSITNITSALGDSVGEVFLSQEIIAESKFVDTNNKPKYLGEDGSKPNGNQPSTYIRVGSTTPGVNLGSGADAVATGSPFIGARGLSEYWARGAVVNGSNYLNKVGGILCASLVKWKSLDSGVTWTVTYANSVTVTNIGNGTDNGVVAYYFGTSEVITWNETSKLRFTDALGFPIPPIIDGNTVLFLDFNDSNDFGFNQGTGGDYTEIGTITKGADINV